MYLTVCTSLTNVKTLTCCWSRLLPSNTSRHCHTSEFNFGCFCSNKLPQVFAQQRAVTSAWLTNSSQLPGSSKQHKLERRGRFGVISLQRRLALKVASGVVFIYSKKSRIAHYFWEMSEKQRNSWPVTYTDEKTCLLAHWYANSIRLN